VIITKLILIRLGGLSVYAEMKTGPVSMDDNTLYRTLNDALGINRKNVERYAKSYREHGKVEALGKRVVKDEVLKSDVGNKSIFGIKTFILTQIV